MSAWDGGDRFSLLLLEQGEYYFRDYFCHYHREPEHRIAGHLKVCSAALYFVPRDVAEPIFKLPFRHTTHISRLRGEKNSAGEDFFSITSTERVHMKIGDQDVPYVTEKGEFYVTLSLVYAALEEVLPSILELWQLCRLDEDEAPRRIARIAEIIREHEENEHFNPGWLEDENERVELQLVVNCITPLCTQPGRVVVTAACIYFQPFHVVSSSPIQKYQVKEVVSILKRTHRLQDNGMELFFTGRVSLYLTFRSKEDRDQCYMVLRTQPTLNLQRNRALKKWTRDWVNGKVSNFEYLMCLNREGGRSFKDLSQYPIFPWVIADYKSPVLDLNNPATFRDLSKPIGALNSKRLNDFRRRYHEHKGMMKADPRPGAPPPLEEPPFLYGSHYSTPGYVVYYLMRSDPQLMLCLQNGRFDAPDRLFWSVEDTWSSVMSLSSDVKELIPEFYSADPSFLLNLDRLDFGVRTAGTKVDHVELPPWASDAQDFVQKLAQAMESPYVSRNLHKWIDLIFGVKSAPGCKAEAADNVFVHLTYDSLGLDAYDKATDHKTRESMMLQMVEFGRTPKQLFKRKHPRRRVHFSVNQRRLMSCFRPRIPSFPSKPLNLLPRRQKTGKEVIIKESSATARAVARLKSRKVGLRHETLGWLEATAARKDPDVLLLKSNAEVLQLVAAAREGGQDSALLPIAIRALKALALAPGNRPLILDAGGLEPLIDGLCSQQPEMVINAVAALALLCKDKDVLLNTFSLPGLRLLLEIQTAAEDLADFETRVRAASILRSLQHSQANRINLARLGGLKVFMGLLSPREPLRLRKQAAAIVVAFLEEDANKVAVVTTDAWLPILVGLCHEEVSELQLSGYRALAALSTNDQAKDPIVNLNALAGLCTAAQSSTTALHAPAAAALANLCSDPTHIKDVVNSEGAQAAIIALARSPDKEVQRHAARALWHLAVGPTDSSESLLASGAVSALLQLAQNDGKSVFAKNLARQALKRLTDFPGVRAEIMAETSLTEAEIEALVFTSLSANSTSDRGLTSSHPSGVSLAGTQLSSEELAQPSPVLDEPLQPAAAVPSQLTTRAGPSGLPVRSSAAASQTSSHVQQLPEYPLQPGPASSPSSSGDRTSRSASMPQPLNQSIAAAGTAYVPVPQAGDSSGAVSPSDYRQQQPPLSSPGLRSMAGMSASNGMPSPGSNVLGRTAEPSTTAPSDTGRTAVNASSSAALEGSASEGQGALSKPSTSLSSAAAPPAAQLHDTADRVGISSSKPPYSPTAAAVPAATIAQHLHNGHVPPPGRGQHPVSSRAAATTGGNAAGTARLNLTSHPIRTPTVDSDMADAE